MSQVRDNCFQYKVENYKITSFIILGELFKKLSYSKTCDGIIGEYQHLNQTTGIIEREKNDSTFTLNFCLI